MKIIVDRVQDLEGDDFIAYAEDKPQWQGRGGTPERAVGRLILQYQTTLDVEVVATSEAQSLMTVIW